MKRIAVVFALLMPLYAGAQELIPKMLCQVKSVYRLNTDGTLTSAKFGPGTNMFANSETFVLDRAAGVFNSQALSNKDMVTTVLDYGSTKQSYKAISRNTTGYVHARYLEVQVFADSMDKPFMMTDGGNIYTGKCSELPASR